MTSLASCNPSYCLCPVRPRAIYDQIICTVTDRDAKKEIHVLAFQRQKRHYISIEAYKAFLMSFVVCFIISNQT